MFWCWTFHVPNLMHKYYYYNIFCKQFDHNKNALSSIESRLLGDNFCCQRRLFFRLEYKTSVICHKINTQNVKIAGRDRPRVLASNWCETFENLLHIDIAPLRRTLSAILRSKNWTMIFIGIRGPWLCQYKTHSFFVADQVMAWYSICSAQGKSVSLTKPYTTHS